VTDVFADLVEQIYEGIDPDNAFPWSDVLGRVAAVIEVDALGFAFHGALGRGRPPFSYGIEPASTLAYPRYHTQDTTWSHALCGKPVGRVQEVLPHDLLERTRVYQEWVRPQQWSQIYHVTMCEQTRGALLVGKLRSRCALQPQARNFLERLAPHVRRTIQARQRLARARDLVQATGHAVNALPIGFLLLDDRGRVVVINTAAQEIARGHSISIRHGVLRLADRASHETLEQGMSARRPVILPIARAGRRDLQLAAVPVDRVGADGGTSGGTAIVLSDPERPLVVSREPLEKLYGLTPAQATLAALLAQGHTPEDCARMLGRTLGTIRDRLKQILARTGTRRQAELVSLLLRNVIDVPTTSREIDHPPARRVDGPLHRSAGAGRRRL